MPDVTAVPVCFMPYTFSRDGFRWHVQKHHAPYTNPFVQFQRELKPCVTLLSTSACCLPSRLACPNAHWQVQETACEGFSSRACTQMASMHRAVVPGATSLAPAPSIQPRVLGPCMTALLMGSSWAPIICKSWYWCMLTKHPWAFATTVLAEAHEHLPP